MPLRQKIQGPPMHRAAKADAAVLDAEKRRFRVSFSSEIELLRASFWDDPWVEVLGHDTGECDLVRLDSGSAPFLWGHDSRERENNVGVIEKAWIENGRGYADIRLSMRPECDGLWRDIQDGIITNISVGYSILERTLTKQTKGEPSQYRVTKWMPFEVSAVSIPADAGVGVGRSDDAASRSYSVTTIEDAMTQPTATTPAPGNPAPDGTRAAADPNQAPPAATVTPDQVSSIVTTATAAALAGERARVSAIGDLARLHDLGEDFTRTHINSGAALEAVRAAALEALAARTGSGQLPRTSVSVGADEIDHQRNAAVAMLQSRAGQKVDKPELLQGNRFRGMTLVDMCRDRLAVRGISTSGWGRQEIVVRAIAHSTSDFPVVLENVMNKTLLARFTATAYAWSLFCKRGTLSDFRPHNRYRMGSTPNLQTVQQDGTYKHGTLSDAEKESIQGSRKGLIIGISREMIINDELGAFLSLAGDFGEASARTIEDDVFAFLATNPNMGDGAALFNSTANTATGGHANLIAYAAPSVASFDSVSQAMEVQRNVGKTDYTGVSPSVWLGPVALRGAAKVVNAAEWDVDAVGAGATNKFQVPNKSRDTFSVIKGTPRLTGNIWYAFADPNISPVIEVAFLDGISEPYTEQHMPFNTDGLEWKARLEYAVGAVGWRGAVKVNG